MNDTSLAPAARRQQCAQCLRPASACICGWIRPTANEVDVLILQHPLEARQAKGSAKLLQLSLAGCTLLIGETLNADVLATHLDRATPSGLPPVNVLLYPDDASASRGRAAALPERLKTSHAGDIQTSKAASLRLVVIDGTWGKSLKMLHLHPVLRTLPRLSLSTTAPSRYLIRKAPRSGQFSTLEATCHALAQLEANTDRYASLLLAFDGFVQVQQAAMGDGHKQA